MAEQQIFQPFPWYNDPQQKNHYKEQCKEECFYKLLTPSNSFLPFQVRRDLSPLPITGLAISCPDGSNNYILDPDVFEIYSTDEGDTIVYDGRPLTRHPDTAPFDWPCGYLVAVMTDGVRTWYSEMFWSENITNFLFNTTNLLETETGENIERESGEPILIL